MPAPEDPHFEPWGERLGEILAGIDQPVVVVRHSLGGSVVLKHLSDTDRGPIAGLLLVAAPFWGKEDWAVEWALPEGWPDATTELPPTFLFHSRDEGEMHLPQLALYAKRLPDAEVHPLDGNGHLFDRGDLTEIVETIRSFSAS